MGKHLLLACLCIFIIAKARAFSISGTVENAGTGLPVAGAYVFIDGTQIVGVTDSAGNFQMENIRFDYFDLIVAAKGFQYLSYRFSKDLINKKIHFKLQNQLSDSIWDAAAANTAPKDVERWQKILLSRFLSDTVNNKTYNYILNPNVLRFLYDSSSHTLKVKATGELYFLNDALGYMVHIFIDEIAITNNDNLFSGYVYYTPLRYKNRVAAEQCSIRRINIYNTSFMRFIRLLGQNTLQPNGFKILPVNRVFEETEEFKQRTQNPGLTILKNDLISPKRFIYVYGKNNIQEKDILVKDSATQALFINPDKYAAISIYNEKNIIIHPSTLFFIPGKQIRIERNGMYFEQNNIAIQGYWQSAKLENLLPFDYDDAE